MQRSSSLLVDPIELRQKNFLFGRKKKKIQKLEKPLTPEETEKLLTSWRETGFAEFNSWIQIARAQMHTEIQENTEGFGRRALKMFCCNLTLRFDEETNLKMVSTGFARSKKDAKRMAIEKVVVELIKNGEIGRGLKNNNFVVQDQNNFNDPNHKISRIQKEAIDESVQKKVQKLTKKIQESLKYGRFFEACESLSQIVIRKKPEWNEV